MGLFRSDITGVDIGASAIKIVRMSRGGKRPKLLAATIVELPEGAVDGRTGAQLRELAAHRFVGRKNVITLLPGKDITIRSLTLPKMPESELREAVRWEAKRHISYPLEVALVEYLINGERREGAVDKYDILLVAAERKTAAGHLVPFREADIEVSAVDASALALRNVLHLREKKLDENNLVVDLGAGKTEINIFKGGALRFSRCVESGGLDMTRAIAERAGMGIEEAEALKRALDVGPGAPENEAVAAVRGRLDVLLMEIRRSVEYYKTTSHEKTVARTVLTGGVALAQGIREYFSASLEGPVELDHPFDELTVKQETLEQFGPQALRFSAAVGLALRKA